MRFLSPFLALFSASAFAQSPPRTAREACRAAHIRGFVIRTASGTRNTNLSRDLCTSNRTDIIDFLGQIAELNRKAAAVVGVPFEKLIPRGYQLIIAEEKLGPLSSFYVTNSDRPSSTPELSIGVFPGWTPAKGINTGVYAHELGHAFFLDPNTVAPPAFQALSRAEFLAEALADLMAIEVTGDVFTNGADLPGCSGDVRLVLDIQNFRYPVDYFRSTFGLRRLGACCEYIGRKNTHTPETRSLCSGIEPAARRLAPLDRTVFTLKEFEKAPLDYDTHQLGLPVNSFLKELSKAIGRSAGKVWFEALRMGAVPPGATFMRSCEIPKLSRLFSTGHFRIARIEKFLGMLRDRLSASERATYDRLATKHDLPTGFFVSAFMLETFGALRTLDMLIEAKTLHSPNAAQNTQEALASGCFRNSVSRDSWQRNVPGCDLKCTNSP